MKAGVNGERSRGVARRHPSGRPTIGLLAGMGARSTGPFLDFVIEECQAQLDVRHEADYPPMVVFSWPIPYYFDRELDHADLQETIARGLEWLESTGVDFIAMPCNSAHVYYESLVERVTVPFINMIDAAVDAVSHEEGPVALLATRSTRDSGLYQRALEAQGLDVRCSEDMQARLDGILGRIREVSDLAEPRARFGELLADLSEEGARNGLIACTDLNYLVAGESPLPLVDSGQALAARVVAHWRLLLEAGTEKAVANFGNGTLG